MVGSVIPSGAWGWYFVLAFVLYQLYAPKFGVQTRLHEIIENLNNRIDKVGQRIDDVEQRQDELVAITQIIAVEVEDIDGEGVKSIFGNRHINEDDVYTDGGEQNDV